MNDTNPVGVTKGLALDNGNSPILQLDAHGQLYRSRNALECLTAGQLLLQVKAVVPHGEFTGRVEVLGFNKKTAERYMACARLFDPDRDAVVLTAVKSCSKMIELLSLESEEIETLRLGGQVRGLTLEGLAAMTAKQIRQVMRQKRENDRLDVDAVLFDKSVSSAATSKEPTSAPLSAADESGTGFAVLLSSKVATSQPLAVVEKAGASAACLTVSLTADEAELLSNYRRCGLKARFHVAQAAELLARI